MNKTINCTETTFTFDHIKKTINGKAIDFKRAGIPGSDHEALLLRRMAEQPTYTLNPITPKKNLNKKTYAGLKRAISQNKITNVKKAAVIKLKSKKTVDFAKAGNQ